ncbi:glycosyltransferase family 4 protein [Arthrobacter sp. zg-Y20]|uniref:glycosyltransferase family 4 protein n=1 Tax=unclassified Arthrobacter TaxID=235627 RepID=UPI001D136B9A|nr:MULTISPECIES: glycosyltransferase family 4 protein [unclassified Arthrobacter]MCC3277243.1 glycosyltransferase family 4 protein [Arthrobacter sp. zg-Y20]MDK1317403.1 glycosyltransferase family 4 protein [Arthrobacter sp. zg.Y20]WIB07176.1 glycosyltransferase family 4 protein [Arthrobacter sp. zg-Y20]
MHSSNEMYGADRVLLQVVQSVPPNRREDLVVWLPRTPGADAGPAQGAQLSDELGRLGFRHVRRNMPVLRRRLISVRGLLLLAGQLASVLPALIRLRPQVLYCSTSALLLLAPIARMLRIPRVVLHIQEIWSGPEAVVLRILSRFATDWIAISRACADSVPPALRHKVHVIANGVEDLPAPQRHGGPEEGGPETQPDGPAGTPLRFVMAGRWNTWKGHECLLSAWDAGDPPGTLSILGGPPATGNAVDVAAMAAGLRQPESVRVVGEVPDITPYVDAADVMVVPSTSPEPFGLVAIEAFARGKPVLGSNAGGLADVVTHGVTGWLYEPGDTAGLATVLRQVDRPRALAMGRLARRAYEEQYTAAIFRENLRAWWKQVLEED